MGWERTQLGKKRLEDSLDHDKDGNAMYGGRRVIGRDAPIDKGVYLGGHGREAIVVDYDRSKMLRTMYSELDLSGDEEHILGSVYDVVDRTLDTQSSHATKELLKAWGCYKNDKRVNLDKFLAEGVGVCRHTALACGVLIERLIERNVLKGKVSVDRNDISLGAHAWCRYEDENGKATVLDVMQDYLGSDDSSDVKWSYVRPDDQSSVKEREPFPMILIHKDEEGIMVASYDSVPADVRSELDNLKREHGKKSEVYLERMKEVMLKYGGYIGKDSRSLSA